MTQLEIVDTHLHFLGVDRFDYPWLEDPDFAFLKRGYALRDWLGDAAGVHVLGGVHVQAEVDHAVDPVEETRWLASLQDGMEPVPMAYVAYADLRAPDLDDTLARHGAAGPVTGIRQEAWYDPESTRADLPRFNLLDDPAWVSGLKRLPEHKLAFDLLVWPHQLAQAATICAEIPGLSVVLEHTGLPPAADTEAFGEWRDALWRFAAEVPNGYLKISAMAFISQQWTVATLTPAVREAIDIFGPQRCMFGSNFPVETVAATYAEVWNAYDKLTSQFTSLERRAMFVENASRVYRLDGPGLR